MVTITPSLRKTTYDPVVSTTTFAVNFPLFDNADLLVVVNDAQRTDYTVSATYVDGISTNAAVIMNSGVIGNVVIYGMRAPARSDQFANGGPLPISNFNYALNRLEIENQEARRDIDQNTADIAQEIIDRGNSVAQVQANLDAETSARIAADAAEMAARISADTIEQAARIAGDLAVASLIGQAGPIEVPFYDTALAVSLANIKPTIKTIRTGGHTYPGDGGDDELTYSATEPAHPLWVQSLDGAYWEKTDTLVRIEQAGGFRGADCSSSAQDALAYLALRGGGKLTFERSGTYLLTSIEGTSDDIEVCVGQGATIQHNPLATASMIKATGSKGFQSAITASVNALDVSVPVADASGFAAGDWVILKDTADYSTDSAAIGYKSGESLVIKSITDNTLYFDRKIFGSWQSDFSYTVARGGNVQKVIPVKNFRVTGEGRLTGFQTQNISLVEMFYVDGASVIGPNYDTFAGPGVLYRTCRNIGHNPGIVADGRNDVANGFPGYGVALWGACDVGRIYGGFYTRTRHAFTTMGSLDGGPSRIYVTGNIVAENDFTGLDTHEGTHEITFDGNKVYGGNAANGAGGINSRSPTTRIINNDVVGVPGNGISAVGQALRSLLIRANSVEDCDGTGITVSSTVRGLYIFDNVVKNSGLHGISCLGVSYDTGVSRLNVAGNKVLGWGRLATTRAGIQVVTTTASFAYIEDNIVDAVNGTEGRGIYISSTTLAGSVSNNKLRGAYSIAALPIPISMLGDGNEWDGAPNFERVTIADDGVYLLPGLQATHQQISIGTSGSGAALPNGIFSVRVSATPQCLALTTFGANVILTTGTLTGTTGTDGNFTISAGTTGVYFENRTGAAITVTIQSKNRL
jgi:hypothetical protein